jgi:hypothetical protein
VSKTAVSRLTSCVVFTTVCGRVTFFPLTDIPLESRNT